jgi:hypothetical protein
MGELSFLLIGLGLFLMFLHLYTKIDTSFDDKFWAKKSSEEVLQERIKHNREGKLNWFYKLDLFFRKLMSEKFFLKTGVILLCIGIILNIIF